MSLSAPKMLKMAFLFLFGPGPGPKKGHLIQNEPFLAHFRVIVGHPMDGLRVVFVGRDRLKWLKFGHFGSNLGILAPNWSNLANLAGKWLSKFPVIFVRLGPDRDLVGTLWSFWSLFQFWSKLLIFDHLVKKWPKLVILARSGQFWPELDLVGSLWSF